MPPHVYQPGERSITLICGPGIRRDDIAYELSTVINEFYKTSVTIDDRIPTDYMSTHDEFQFRDAYTTYALQLIGPHEYPHSVQIVATHTDPQAFFQFFIETWVREPVLPVKEVLYDKVGVDLTLEEEIEMNLVTRDLEVQLEKHFDYRCLKTEYHKDHWKIDAQIGYLIEVRAPRRSNKARIVSAYESNNYLSPKKELDKNITTFIRKYATHLRQWKSQQGILDRILGWF